jgi:DNA polymerase III subunit delta'
MVSESFSHIIGQSQAVELLTQAIHAHKIAPAYLFAGAPGIGRKLVAKAFLSMLVADELGRGAGRKTLENHPDLLWVEPTYNHQGKFLTAAELLANGNELPKSRPQVRLEQVRNISRFLSQSPLELSRLAVVIEGAETMGESAANGLLKTLEEPGRGMLILLTPSKEVLLPTIVSRCQLVSLHRLSRDDLQKVLHNLGRSEILAHADILQMAQGSPGSAIECWDRLSHLPEGLAQLWEHPFETPRQCLEVAQRIDHALDGETQLWLLDYLQYRYWDTLGNPDVLKALEKAKSQLLAYAQPRLVWEVTLLKLLELQYSHSGDRA